MTDNSEFRARYLPTHPERHDPGTPAAQGGDAVAMPDPRLPEPAAPVAPHPHASPGGHTHTPAPGGVSGFDAAPGEPTRASAEPAPPPVHAVPQQYSAPPDAPAWMPAGHGGQEAFYEGATTPPAPIPPMPRLKERFAAPAPPQPWAPQVDPGQRWAPQADPRATTTPLRHIQIDEVVKKRREPPTLGWRKTLYTATGGVVNPGVGPYERTLRDWTARITSNIPGNYQIAAVSVKGGVGKTRVTAGVGSVFAKQRGGNVIAVDADTTYGGLGRFVDPTMTASVREFLADPEAVTHPRVRPYTGINDQRLEVLASHQNVASEFSFDQQTFFDTLSRTREIYQLCLVDSAEIESDVFKAVLSSSDALMIVGTCTAEGGLAVETTVNWLAARRGHELLKRSVIVLNDAHRSASPKFLRHISETVGKRVRTVKTIPWDPHLRDAATLDFAALRKRTQLALLDLAAELAAGFPTAGALTG